MSKPDRFSSCAIIPGRVTDSVGFVTEHRELDGLNGPIKLYFSVLGLQQLAERYPEVGLVPAEKLRQAQEDVDELEDALASANKRIAELESQHDRIAGLAAEGFEVRKKMGRPTKEKS